MKKIIAFLLTLAMLLSLAACGGSAEEDPNAGKYLGTTAKAFGMVMPMTDIYEGETWLELRSGGRGTIMLDGDSFPMKWSLEGDIFTLTIDGEDSVGTLEDGVIIVDLMDMGVEMTFVKEGMEPPAPKATYDDAGYYDLIRIDGATAEDSVSEEDLTMLRELGMYMYLELLEDGTGAFFMEEEMAVTWVDGTVNFTEDNMSISYTLENGELVLDMLEAKLFFRKGEKPAATEPVETEPPVVAEMEAAGFTDFMEVGVPYAYTALCPDGEDKLTTAEAMVSSYEIFDSAEGYPAMEGYEWRVVKIDVRFYDENAKEYGRTYASNTEDYYNTRLHDDTNELLEETDDYSLYGYKILYNGQEMDAYRYSSNYWTDGPNGNGEWMACMQWDFLVPIGYDGCVAGLRDNRVEWRDGSYLVDGSYDPADFLLFRLN